MSCAHCNIPLRYNQQDKNPCLHYLVLQNVIIVPVFCVCLISAMGVAAGLRQVVFMQFDVDADTEYINFENAAFYQTQHTYRKKINF